MRFIRKLLAGLYAGSAFSKFINKKYKDAARLFEKSLRLDPNSGRLETMYSCLGRCYLALGQIDAALQNLTVAYNLYEKNISAVQGDFESTQYKECLKAYSYALKKVGQLDFSQEITQKAEEFANGGKKNYGQ